MSFNSGLQSSIDSFTSPFGSSSNGFNPVMQSLINTHTSPSTTYTSPSTTDTSFSSFLLEAQSMLPNVSDGLKELMNETSIESWTQDKCLMGCDTQFKHLVIKHPECINPVVIMSTQSDPLVCEHGYRNKYECIRGCAKLSN
jgi:hypothetical protein